MDLLPSRLELKALIAVRTERQIDEQKQMKINVVALFGQPQLQYCNGYSSSCKLHLSITNQKTEIQYTTFVLQRILVSCITNPTVTVGSIAFRLRIYRTECFNELPSCHKQFENEKSLSFTANQEYCSRVSEALAFLDES